MVVAGAAGLTGEDESTPQTEDTPESSGQVMDLLEEHVPLSLLLDLVAPTGPDSQDILSEEGPPEHAWWEPDS